MRKVILVGCLSSVFFLLFFWHGLILNIDKPISDHNDITYQYFIFDNNFSKLSNLDFANLFETRMFYPKINTLAYGNSYLGQTSVSLPFFLITQNTILSVNLVFILNFFIAFLAMYLLSYKLTKNIGASLVAGLIYTYNPYVLAHNQMELLTLEWIPIVFLSAEMYLTKKSWFWSPLMFLFLFLQLTSSFYYFMFVVLLLPIYIGIRIYLLKLKPEKLVTLTFVLSALVFMVVSYLFLAPYLKFRQEHSLNRSIETNQAFSATVNDFFFTSPQNVSYGQFSKSQLREPFAAEHPTEHSLFPGIVVILLLIFSGYLMLAKKKNKDFINVSIPLFCILLLSFVLSFGPYFKILDFNLPSLYLAVYKFVPFSDALRVPSRFMVIGFLAAAVLVGLSVSFLSAKAKKLGIWVIFLILFLITVEYMQLQKPPTIIKTEIKSFYSWLAKQDKIKTILELPIGNQLPIYPSLSREFIEDSQYLMYGIYHDKYIFNGYNAFVPPEYIIFSNSLALEPIDERKLKELKMQKIDVIVIHQEEYKNRKFASDIIESLDKLPIKKIYDTYPIKAYKIN